MTGWLDDAIARSSGPVNEFLGQLKEMLEHVRPAALDEARSSATWNGELAEIRLAHGTRPDWSIWVEAQDDQVVVGVGLMHEHLGAEWSGEEGRPFSTVAVDFVAELLRGEIEIATTFRGDLPTVITHRRVDEPVPLGETGFIPALMFWRPKRTTVERVSFEARG